MSSVISHVRSLPGRPSLRAVHLPSGRPWQKACGHHGICFPMHKRDGLRPDAIPVTRTRHLSQSTTRGNRIAAPAMNKHTEQEDDCKSQELLSASQFEHNHLFANGKGAQMHGSQTSSKEPSFATSGQSRRSPSGPRPTPTEYLINSLRETGHTLGKGGRLRHNVDLSRINLGKPVSLSRLRRYRRPKLTSGQPQRLAFQTILANYLREVDPFLSGVSDTDTGNPLDKVPMEVLLDVFSTRHSEYLASRGYDAADVVAWAWILKAPDAHQAALRLFALEAHNKSKSDATRGVPPFIPLFLLKERSLDAHTFRLLLIYSLHLMSGQPIPAGATQSTDDEISSVSLPDHSHVTINPSMCMIFVVRLIRHARQVWPQALPTIAKAFARFLGALSIEEPNSSGLTAQLKERLRTDKFNSCLFLLSLPTKIHPFRSVSIQQQAQFELLRAMAAHKPVLPVTRKGYQAVIAIQLAHKKTLEERQSAELKAPSWPPWKEEKLGIDSQRGNEGRFSRAMQVMSQMKEAGYSHGHWEQIATVLAGWDTDGSPTVQTRSMMIRPESLPASREESNHNPLLWVARIRATRTVREAWACFLSYQDRGLPLSGGIYAAMGEKLVQRKKAIERGFDHTSQALPGDGPEVHPEPASARDIIYVHTEPPTLDEFLEEMLSHGFHFSGRFLALLLTSASTFREGLHYLQNSNLAEDEIEALTSVRSQPSEYKPQDLERLGQLSDFLYVSFIRFLCRHSTFHHFRLGHDGSHEDEHPEQRLQSRALPHAIHLIKLRKSLSRGAWQHVLAALADERERITEPYRKISRGARRILVWNTILDILKEHAIELDVEGFHSMCVRFEKAVAAGIQNPDEVQEAFISMLRSRPPRDAMANTEHGVDLASFVQNGLHFLKTHFDHLVLPASKTSEVAEQSIFVTGGAGPPLNLPNTLHPPSPAALHAFTRALGTAEDHEGLLNLLRWMSRSADQLEEAAGEHLNGAKLLRQTLVAMRVFLETGRGDPSVQEEAYDIITRTPGWTWPSGTAVRTYLRIRKSP